VSRLLGIDLGTRRIGVALGDLTTGHARPLVTLSRRDVASDAASIGRLAREHDVAELVVGLPLSLDGSEGRQAASTRGWADAVAPLTGLRVTWQDERHTSQDAEQRLGGPGRGRAGGPPSAAALRAYRARVDREAAAAIAQAALDGRRMTPSVDPGARP
jgi:putative pre-16S rRNA nuclease